MHTVVHTYLTRREILRAFVLTVRLRNRMRRCLRYGHRGMSPRPSSAVYCRRLIASVIRRTLPTVCDVCSIDTRQPPRGQLEAGSKRLLVTYRVRFITRRAVRARQVGGALLLASNTTQLSRRRQKTFTVQAKRCRVKTAPFQNSPENTRPHCKETVSLNNSVYRAYA